MTFKFHLPYPCSVNSMYPGKNRRHKSKEYKAWILEATIMLNQQSKPVKPINYPVQVTYKIGKPSDNRRRDIFNLEKGMGDILVDCDILKDDSIIHRGIIEWACIDGVDVEISLF